jgi:superfamily I DNA/RNA helicase
LKTSAQVIKKNVALIENGGRHAVYSDIVGDRHIPVMQLASENAEAVAIGQTIEKMVGGTGFFSFDTGVTEGTVDRKALSFADFAVLFRTRSQGRVILKFLEKAGIPCQLIDRKRVLDHPGIKAVISVFKLLLGVGLFSDLQTTAGVFNALVSKKSIQILKSWSYQKEIPLEEALFQLCRLPIPQMGRARQQQLYVFTGRFSRFKKKIDGLPVAKTLEMILQRVDYREKYKGDQPFERGAAHLLETGNAYQKDSAGFLAAIALAKDEDTYDHRVEKVALTTMHAAKGLEFPVVFIAGCEDGFIPYRSNTRPVDMEEERRLFYVALTRAKRHLFLTKADHRRLNGRKQPRDLSPFVEEIDDQFKYLSIQGVKKTETPTQEQLSLF